MLKRVEVKDPGDSELLSGEVIDLLDINVINDKLEVIKRNLQYSRVLLGITKASPQTNYSYLPLLFKKLPEFLPTHQLKEKLTL